MELTISVLSKAGGRTVNEDAYGVWTTANACFCVLSDGAGGHLGGELASKLAVKHVLDWFSLHPEPTAAAVAAALKAANDAVVEQQQRMPEVADMRATVVVLAIDTVHATACWGYLGDSRLYCFRNQRIIAQSRDHSMVQGMVDAGYLAADALRTAPSRNVLLAALGDAEHFNPRVEVTPCPVVDGDVFLLCTDGLWEYIDEAHMERSLRLADSPETWLRHLETEVLRHGPPDQDNYSALVIACAEIDQATRMLPSAAAPAPG
jgi:serine/threonine protein phosphatase PrpC